MLQTSMCSIYCLIPYFKLILFVLNRYKDNNLPEMEPSSSIKKLCQIVKRYLPL